MGVHENTGVTGMYMRIQGFTGVSMGVHENTYILLDVLVCSIAVYFYELCHIVTSP